MTQRLVRVLAIVLTFMVCAAAPQQVRAQDTTLVFVFKDRVMITILPPKLRVRPPRDAGIGFYSWRIDIRGAGAADGASIAFTADTAMRTTNIRDIVRSSTLRRCAEPKDFSTLRCRIPMSDSVMVRGEGIRIVVRDEAIVAMMRRVRPASVWRATFEPNGQFRVDRLSVRYADGEPE